MKVKKLSKCNVRAALTAIPYLATTANMPVRRADRRRVPSRGATQVLFLVTISLLGVTGLVAPASAAPAPPGPGSTSSLVFLVDVSGSMSGVPLTQAKSALSAGIDALPSSTAVGLRSYAGQCGNGGNLVVPISTNNRVQLHAAVDSLSAGGGTPTPDAIRAAANDLPTQGDRAIVLISDGQSTCGDPCPVAQSLKNTLGIDFRVHTVGFNAPTQAETELACIARVTDGEYFQATDTATLTDALGQIIAGRKHYRVEIKAWIPQEKVVDPKWPADTPFRRAYYRGDDHRGYEGDYRVMSAIEFDWDGKSLTNVTFDNGFGLTIRDEYWRICPGLFGVRFVCPEPVPGGEWEHYVFDGQATRLADGYVQLQGFGLRIDSHNPSVGNEPIINSQRVLPAIDSLLTGTFVDGGDYLRLDYDTDLFPSHGIQVSKNGVPIFTSVVLNAECVNTLGPRGLVNLTYGLSRQSNEGSVRVPLVGVRTEEMAGCVPGPA